MPFRHRTGLTSGLFALALSWSLPWASRGAAPDYAPGRPKPPPGERKTYAGPRVKLSWRGGGEPRDRGSELAALPQVGTPDDAVRAEWAFAAGGWGIGNAGLHVVDLAGNGERRVVTATFSGYWYVLRYEGGAYVQEWVSDRYPEPIDTLRVANVDADAAQEILVATGPRILVYQGPTPSLEREIVTPGKGILGLTVVDVDGDGALELVFGADPVDYDERRTLYVLDYASGAVEYAGAGLGGRDLAVGNVDADPALEIVVASGGGLPGYVLDGPSRSVEWTNALGFGWHVRLGDLDGDGRQEAVTASEWGGIRVFDTGLRSLTASIPVDDPIYALRVADVEGDGSLEILYGQGGWGGVHVVNGQTRTLKWEVATPDSGVSNIAVGDSDGDGRNELVFGAGHASSGPDHLFVVDTQSHATKWQSVDLVGPFWVSTGDVDGDGATEIISASSQSESGYGAGRWSVHDGSTHRLEFQSVPLAWYDWNGLYRIRNANVDGDVQQEVFTNGSTASGGQIVCYDGRTHAEQWRTLPSSTGSFLAFDLGDVDGDSRLELVGVSGTVVYVYDASTGALEWKSPSLPPVSGALSLLRIANIDADPRPEILLGSSTSTGILYVLDVVAGTTQALAVPAFTAFETFDPDGDGRKDLLLGDENGTIWRAAGDGTAVRVVALGGPEVNAIAAADLDGQPGLEFVVARANELSIHAADGSLLWRSGPLSAGLSIGAHDGLHVADVDNDGRKEILVTVAYGFRVYEVVSLPQTSASVNDLVVSEDGGVVAWFTVSLSAPSSLPVKVSYATVSGTAMAGSDFVAASGTLTFDPGITSLSVGIAIVGDRIHENDESFELRLKDPEYVRLADATGLGTITNDDPPGLSVSSVDVREPESGVALAQFEVTLSPAWPTEVIADYATEDGTATSPDDYLSLSGQLVFAPGEQVKTVPVTIHTDEVTERAEIFTLNLANAVGSEIVDGIGVGRIIDRSASLFFTLTPCRLFDSRTTRPLDAGASVLFQAFGRCGVPAGARALALNVTVTQPSAAGHIIVIGNGSPPPATSNLNFIAGQTRANSAVVSLGASGLLRVSSGQSSGSVHFILDVAGYFK